MAATVSSSNRAPYTHDLVLVGGGLQNGLIALACLAERADMRLVVVEQAAVLGGNHTWSLHARDVPDAAKAMVEPLIAHRYDAYDVRFPGFARTLRSPYAVITSERFDHVLKQALGPARLRLQRCAREVLADQVVLDDGEVLRAPLVIDARGPGRAASTEAPCGYQKFVGLELELTAPHALRTPILMDATVPQDDGFRFFYVLPLGPSRLLVEDTTFSRSPALDVTALTASSLEYAKRFGEVDAIVRKEQGLLPMPWAGALPEPSASPLLAGYQGGFFHPGTGYSLPCALRLALVVAAHAPYAVFGADLAAHCRAHRTQARFSQRLNALLFHAFAPRDMWNVLARFYRLPEDLIERFYALEMTTVDRARILIGRPPKGFSPLHALSQLRSTRPLGAT